MWIYKLIIIYLQGVMLLRIIKDKRVYVWQDDTNEETKQTQENGKLQKVKRNRATLDVKRGFELRYKKAFVNQPLQKFHIKVHIWNWNFIYEMKIFIYEIRISHVKR
jgi:hypothetical protein